MTEALKDADTQGQQMNTTTPFAQAAIACMTAISAGAIGYIAGKIDPSAFAGVFLVCFVASFLAYFAAGGDQ